MTSNARSIGISCFVWSLIGCLLSLAVSKHFGWSAWPCIPGAFFSGIMAYLFEDIGAVWQGCVRSWRKLKGWEPDRVWWKCYFQLMLPLCVMLYSITFWIICLIIPIIAQKEVLTFVIGMTIVANCLSICFSGVFVSMNYFINTIWENEHKKQVKFLKHVAWCVCPLMLPRHVMWLIPQLVKATPRAVVLFKDFLKQVFIFIHTTRRLICLVDTAIAIGIGFAYGEVHHSVLLGTIVGAVVGPMFGILNYEVVSKRWLKIQPA